MNKQKSKIVRYSSIVLSISAMYETNVKDLAASRSVHSFNSQQKEPTTRDEDFSPGEIEYTTNQILYSYWWCFWHVCLRCVRRVRLTPATRDEFGFHPEVLSPDQLGGKITLNHV